MKGRETFDHYFFTNPWNIRMGKKSDRGINICCDLSSLPPYMGIYLPKFPF